METILWTWAIAATVAAVVLLCVWRWHVLCYECEMSSLRCEANAANQLWTEERRCREEETRLAARQIEQLRTALTNARALGQQIVNEAVEERQGG